MVQSVVASVPLTVWPHEIVWTVQALPASSASLNWTAPLRCSPFSITRIGDGAACCAAADRDSNPARAAQQEASKALFPNR